MSPKAFSFTLLIILVSSNSFCFGNPKIVHHPSSSKINCHSVHSESPKTAPIPSLQSSHRGAHCAIRRSRHPVFFNVDHFGAKADGHTDNSQAFRRAWDTACKSSRQSIILVPRHKTYYMRRVNFTGPCKSSMKMEVKGTIKAFSELYNDTKRFWIKFQHLRNFKVEGGGIIDGNGEIWWNNSCKIKKTLPCQNQHAPAAVTFDNCMNLEVTNLRIQNSQQMHLIFQDSTNVKASYLRVTAPGKSPNTDGIHVTRTHNIDITASEIKTGDDCISIVNGSKSIRVTDIVCGPGHGISIGSLGENNSENHVSNVLVDGAMLLGTTNGVRIKTWQGGSGYAKDIIFQNIEMHNVSNPIIINQNYCDQDESCHQQKSAVQIMNVVYKNIRGTSASEVAIKLNCSDTVPCRELVLENVYLNRQGKGEAEAKCSNVVGLSNFGRSVSPICHNISN